MLHFLAESPNLSRSAIFFIVEGAVMNVFGGHPRKGVETVFV